jgi:hypothetical protein
MSDGNGNPKSHRWRHPGRTQPADPVFRGGTITREEYYTRTATRDRPLTDTPMQLKHVTAFIPGQVAETKDVVPRELLQLARRQVAQTPAEKQAAWDQLRRSCG